MSVRLAVFDCDGTLVDGQAAVCNAMAAAFAGAGLPAPDRNAVRRAVGLSLPQAIRLLVPDESEATRAEIDRIYRDSFRAAREAGLLVEPLYDGIADLIAALKADGWMLGVATGKSDRGLAHCLSVHGLSAQFSTLQTADRHPSKPHPAMLEAAMDDCLALPADTVMIGDTQYDMAMAATIGVRALGVDWGYHTVDDLISAGAETVATSPAHLLELLS
ncbi:phosphoglycolate phosphatase [Novosphingobium kunmingense]|uniref:Phosphoglycolate phosphatase n=1 Tax=Novosphingobium kunmingense TaxID=1211806 RepID=A0A2N0HKV0_9SPHN|nr:HAD-IA family hydrolase [Novosphingobium kunmingense]PKB19485.1 phosphoglycolate phosphatase [Novosphingobium kunmingense]